MTGPGPLRAQLWKAIPWMIVVVAAVVSYQTMRPPSPGDSAGQTDFSAGRAFAHVEAIAAEPHPMGSAANTRVRSYIIDTLRGLGVAVETQKVIAPDYFGAGEPVEVVNVVGKIAGTASTGAIALIAHYDTVPTTAGANDNSAAVGALLETARALLAGAPLDNDVLLVFTDAEEPSPRYGASAFFSESPAAHQIALAVNLEATGQSGASLLVETSGPEGWLLAELAASEAPPAAFSFLTETARLLGEIGTDFDEIRNAGVPGMHFAYLHGSSIYHTDGDSLDNIDLGSLQHHGLHALETARRFGHHDFTAATPRGDAVFFSVGSLLIRYPAILAIPLMLVAVIGATVGFAHRYRHGSAISELRGAGMAFAGLVCAAGTGALAWMLITGARETLGLMEGYFYFGALAVAVGGGMLWIASRSPRLARGRHTPVLVWLMLTALTAFLGVGFSYLFAWPALLIAVALWWKSGGVIQETIRFGLIATVTLLLVAPAIDVFLQFAYPRPGNPDSSIPGLVFVPLFMTLLAAGFLRFVWPAPWRSTRQAGPTS